MSAEVAENQNTMYYDSWERGSYNSGVKLKQGDKILCYNMPEGDANGKFRIVMTTQRATTLTQKISRMYGFTLMGESSCLLNSNINQESFTISFLE